MEEVSGNTLEYFEKLDEILSAHPATCPPSLLETLDSQTLHTEHISDETDVEGYQEESDSQEHNYADDISENQSSSSSTASVSGSFHPQLAQPEKTLMKFLCQTKWRLKERKESEIKEKY